jgi:DnaJ-class molecular chaperone
VWVGDGVALLPSIEITMKLEEAADLLGVSIDTPVDILKQTYRRLALHWHPDKVCKTVCAQSVST